MNYSSKKKKIFKNSHFETFLDHRNDVNFFHGLTAATSEGQAFPPPLCFTWHRGNFHCRSLKDTEWVFILYMVTQTFEIPELWAESLLLAYLEWAPGWLPSCKSTKFLLKPNQLPWVEQIPSEQVRLKAPSVSQVFSFLLDSDISIPFHFLLNTLFLAIVSVRRFFQIS